MPELTINVTQAPPASSTAGANALNQGDAAGRSGEGMKADAEGGTETPFAATLKSHMDRQAAGSSKAAASKAADGKVEPVATGIALDIAALLLGVDPAAMAGLPAVPATIPEPSSANPEQALSQPLPPVLAALAAAVTAPAQAIAASGSAPARSPGMPSSAPAPLLDAGRSRQTDVEGTVTGASPASPDMPIAPQVTGKIAPDAAINADTASAGVDGGKAEMASNDFRALLDRASAMASPTTNPANGSGNASGPSLRVDTPLGQNGWHEEIGQKLTWMVGNNRQQADLVLTPPQLGRVEVSLTMNGDQATATFTSSNPAVREALEASLQRLREVLADAGVSLAQTHVGSESPQQSSRKDPSEFGAGGSMPFGLDTQAPVAAAVARTSVGRSMIDVFA